VKNFSGSILAALEREGQRISLTNNKPPSYSNWQERIARLRELFNCHQNHRIWNTPTRPHPKAKRKNAKHCGPRKNKHTRKPFSAAESWRDSHPQLSDEEVKLRGLMISRILRWHSSRNLCDKLYRENWQHVQLNRINGKKTQSILPPASHASADCCSGWRLRLRILKVCATEGYTNRSIQLRGDIQSQILHRII
jgi:hypothetical protein